MKKILVIDDDQNLDENTAELLAIAGFSVATTGQLPPASVWLQG